MMAHQLELSNEVYDRALPAAFGEFADQVSVAAAQDVGFDIVKAKALFADTLIKLLKRSSERSRTPWIVALKSMRSTMPLSSGFLRASFVEMSK